MVKLLIIADDFTGALDTGIQFAKRGIQTQVFVGTKLDEKEISDRSQVLVVDSETRPLSGEQAYQTVKEIVVDAKRIGIPVIFKKTDSALRGNVGAELKAVLDAAEEEELYFIPAFPDVRRTTSQGIHYIDGKLLEHSAFAKDPFEPVHCSYIPQLLSSQCAYEVRSIGIEDPFPVCEKSGKRIYVFDALEKRHIDQRVHQMKEKKKLRLVAGCAGLAQSLFQVLHLEEGYRGHIEKSDGLYVACGSLNPITREQVEDAVKKRCGRISLMPRQKLERDYCDTEEGKKLLRQIKAACGSHEIMIVDTFDGGDQSAAARYARESGIDVNEIRYRISSCHGKILRYLIEQGMKYTIMMTGGDTLMGFMKEIGVTQIFPVCEIEQGAVLSVLRWNGREIQVISKSGGFGCKDIITRIAEKVIERQAIA